MTPIHGFTRLEDLKMIHIEKYSKAKAERLKQSNAAELSEERFETLKNTGSNTWRVQARH